MKKLYHLLRRILNQGSSIVFASTSIIAFLASISGSLVLEFAKPPPPPPTLLSTSFPLRLAIPPKTRFATNKPAKANNPNLRNAGMSKIPNVEPATTPAATRGDVPRSAAKGFKKPKTAAMAVTASGKPKIAVALPKKGPRKSTIAKTPAAGRARSRI